MNFIYRFFLFPLFLVIGYLNSISAQENYILEGYMGVKGGESFNYKLELQDSVGNILKGYAYTYKIKDNAVKAYVVAVVDREKRTLHIREKNITSNNNFVSKATICLVDALLQWNENEGNLSGSLITQTSNYGATCSSGSIMLAKKNQVDNLFNPPKPVAATTPVKPGVNNSKFQLVEDPNKKLHNHFRNKQANSEKEVKQQGVKSENILPKKEEITEGKDIVFEWHSDKVVFEIWDGGEIDHDIVTVHFNGREVLPFYTLKADKKRLVFDVGDNLESTITITANNEGANPPNTADVLLKDGDKKHSVVAHNKIGKKAVIKIRKVSTP